MATKRKSSRSGEWFVQSVQFRENQIFAAATDADMAIDYAEKHCESPIEKIMYLHLWEIARNPFYGTDTVSVYPQAQIESYRVDFLVVTDETKAVIECDGHDFHEKTKEQVIRDKQRERTLMKLGYQVVRFSGSELYHGLTHVRDELEPLLSPRSRHLDVLTARGDLPFDDCWNLTYGDIERADRHPARHEYPELVYRSKDRD